FLNPTNTAATPSTTLQQYRGFFNITTPSNYVPDRIEIANTDMLFLMWGRPSYSVTSPAPPTEVFTLNNLVTGLWGETSALLAGVNAFHAGNPNAPQMFPRPGQSANDDDNDRYAGIYETDLIFGNSVLIPPFSHPLDYYGSGNYVVSSTTIGL